MMNYQMIKKRNVLLLTFCARTVAGNKYIKLSIIFVLLSFSYSKSKIEIQNRKISPTNVNFTLSHQKILRFQVNY